MKAVSYTHLDVYKRQVLDRMLLGALRVAYFDFLSRDRHPAAVLNLICDPERVDVNAVSYTHLDVYKRQTLNSAARMTAACWSGFSTSTSISRPTAITRWINMPNLRAGAKRAHARLRPHRARNNRPVTSA